MSSESKVRSALVTGGSRGIGAAIAKRLAGDGFLVGVNYRGGKDAAEAVVQEIEAAGGKAFALQFDISDPDSVGEGVKTFLETAGGIDVLINNAGVSRDGLFVRMKDEDWDFTLQTNLSGPFFVSRVVGKTMMKARAGRIVHISSVVGQMGNAGQASYVSAKAGLIGLTKAMARELASRGILVNAVAPGFIETDMTSALDEKTRDEHKQMIPLGCYGSPEDVAGTVSFLCSPDAQYITGQVLSVNGGMYM